MSSNTEYMREYMKARYHRRKAQAIEKLGGKCARCGSTVDLQFDHREREGKSFTICKYLSSVSEAKFLEELDKCQLLCNDCHQKKTCGELGKTYSKGSHGTLSSYRYCKCDVCRAAKATWTRQYRDRQV